MSDFPIAQRPPIGLIVEGNGEFYNLPRIACRILDTPCNTRASNARGSGNIITRLDQYIRDIVQAHHPYWIIVTLDKQDALSSGTFTDCAALVAKMKNNAEKCLEDIKGFEKYQPLPSRISIIIQVPKFESWLIADCHGLSNCSFIQAAKCVHPYENVDLEEANPTGWLQNCCHSGIDIKKREYVAEMVKSIDLNIVCKKSPSFNKFCRDITRAYNNWCQELII